RSPDTDTAVRARLRSRFPPPPLGEGRVGVQPVPDGKDLDVEAVADQTPDTAGQEHRYENPDDAHEDEIPGAQLGQALLNGKEDARPQNRSLDAAHAADQGDENHLRRPLDAEDRARQNVELADDEQRAPSATARRRNDIDDPLRRRHPHSNASGGDLVIAD